MAYFVYELVSQERSEVFVNIATRLDAELGRLRRERPPWLEDWSLPDLQKLRVVEVFSELGDACRFAHRYAARTQPPGWKIIRGRDLRGGLCSDFPG